MPRRSRLIDVIGTMPFIGNNMIRATFLEGLDTAKQGNTELRDQRAKTLSWFAIRHTVQAAAGVLWGSVHLIHSLKYGRGSEGFVQATYDSAYAAVNGVITYSQFYLAKTLRQTPLLNNATYSEPVGSYDISPSRIESVATITAQCLFIATIATALPKAVEIGSDLLANY